MSIRARFIDERFLAGRLRSTSTAGVIAATLATCLFAYRYYVNHLWSWDLFAVAVTFVAIKAVVLARYLLAD